MAVERELRVFDIALHQLDVLEVQTALRIAGDSTDSDRPDLLSRNRCEADLHHRFIAFESARPAG